VRHLDGSTSCGEAVVLAPVSMSEAEIIGNSHSELNRMYNNSSRQFRTPGMVSQSDQMRNKIYFAV